VVDVAMNAKSLHAGEKQTTASFIRKLGLPPTFSELDIKGLDVVAGSRELTQRNKELIFRFLSHISPEVSDLRLTFYTHKLQKLGRWLKKDFDAVTEQDLRSLVTFLSKGRAREDGGVYKRGTLHGYKVTLKRFYRWLEGNDEEYPRKVRWIRSNGDAARIQEPEQLLTFQEVLEMIRHASNPRDKALVSFLYESGARISEMLAMKIRHLDFSPDMLRATLPVSKTRPRTIPLVSCRRHMASWMNYHPLKDSPEAPLWSNMKQDGDRPLRAQTVGRILRRIASEAGINKRIYPHLFRACSITHKQASGWPEQMIKSFHGLSKDSKVMKHYSHLSYSDLERMQKKMNGLPTEDTADLNSGVKCPGCGKKNPIYVEICDCGLPTEMKHVQGGHSDLVSEIESRVEKRINEFLDSRRAQDEMMERFMAALVDKSKRSPALLKAIGEIGIDMREKQKIFQTSAGCYN
jgi:site-specific recombinase XerD